MPVQSINILYLILPKLAKNEKHDIVCNLRCCKTPRVKFEPKCLPFRNELPTPGFLVTSLPVCLIWYLTTMQVQSTFDRGNTKTREDSHVLMHINVHVFIRNEYGL